VLRSANQTADLLAHEQGHYDIGVLAARALAADLASLSAKTPSELSRLANDTFTLHTRTRLGPIQRDYDNDTNHSQNTQEQQRWSQMIARAMANSSATSINNLPL
jgi:predicted secreted Zn-dependent protease